MRDALAAGEVRQPRSAVFEDHDAVPRRRVPVRGEADRALGQPGRDPCDDPGGSSTPRAGADRRVAGTARCSSRSTCPGVEVAVEGLLRDGAARGARGLRQARPARGPVLRGDDLRHAVATAGATARRASRSLTERATRAIGLTEGPVHAEVRDRRRAACWVIEVAARSIGGLCARTLRFGAGISLEEVILRHALGLPARRPRARAAGGGRDDAADPARRDARRGARPRGRARGRRASSGSRSRSRAGATRRARCPRATATSGSCSPAADTPGRGRSRAAGRAAARIVMVVT